MTDFDITNPSVSTLLSRQVANNENDYSAFISTLYAELATCFECLEEEANQHNKKNETEISSSIKMYLRGAKYRCTTETNSNGHVDLTVEENNFKWLGEAKIQRGNDWTYHGFDQLTANYSTGRPNSCHGAIIVYNKIKKTSLKCAQEWRECVEGLQLNIECSDYEPDGYFDMVVPEHPRSGTPYYIRSFFITLHYTPSAELGNKK